MPSANDDSAYQQFELLLQRLQTTLANQTWSVTALKAEVSQLQQVFQTQIAAETNLAEEPNPIQAIQTEINKQLRLLETDVLFLQAARQPAKVQHRQQQIVDRLNLLLNYCAAVLDTDS